MAQADSPTKTCGEDGCGRPLRARGLCSTHYNQRYCPIRHPKVTASCGWCGRPCKKAATKRYPNRFCSLSCRDTWRRRDKLPVLFVGAVVRPAPEWPTPKQRAARLFVGGVCVRCGSVYLAEDYTDTARYCSHSCYRSDSKDRRRARKRSAYVAPVRRRQIFERDRWRCKLCRKPVRRDAVVPHPLAPVLDHVIPLARGGTHEPANVQCAHFICNSIKSDRGGYEQLALIG